MKTANRRQKKAAQYIIDHGVIAAAQLAIRARETGHKRVAKTLFNSLVAELDRRKKETSLVPHDDHKCPHSPDRGKYHKNDLMTVGQRVTAPA